MLYVTKVLLLVLGVLLLGSGSSERIPFSRAANYVAGITLPGLLVAVLYMWR